jgi:VIT1/CCC1 family predicted Fe2+/Mn2+ transporter
VHAASLAHADRRLRIATHGHGVTGRTDYLGKMVYGALTGVFTAFAVVSGVTAAGLGPRVVLALGAADLVANGLASGAGTFLEARTDDEVVRREREHLSRMIVEHPAEEREALYHTYIAEGYAEGDARTLAGIVSHDSGRWVNAALDEHLLIVPRKNPPAREALASLASTVLFGLVPLVAYAVDLLPGVTLNAVQAFAISAVLASLTLYLLGVAKARITGTRATGSGLEILAIGALISAVAYTLGALLRGLGVTGR